MQVDIVKTMHEKHITLQIADKIIERYTFNSTCKTFNCTINHLICQNA